MFYFVVVWNGGGGGGGGGGREREKENQPALWTVRQYSIFIILGRKVITKTFDRRLRLRLKFFKKILRFSSISAIKSSKSFTLHVLGFYISTYINGNKQMSKDFSNGGWLNNKWPMSLNGHLNMRDSMLTSYQKGSYLHINRATIE